MQTKQLTKALMQKNAVILIVGPTGSGKSDVALRLARKINGEIVSCDSMQIYHGMNIGTAKPTAKELRLVKHHLVSIFSPRTEYSVYRHLTLALKVIKQIIRKKCIPIVVGGSGLYLKSLLDGLRKQGGKQKEIRGLLEQAVKSEGVGVLHNRLVLLNPKRAAQIHPHDARRIVRALEIEESVANGKCEAKDGFEAGLYALGYNPQTFGLMWERSVLYERIEKRVDQMLEDGWLDEVKQLKDSKLSRTASQAIGYCELLEYLREKKTSLETVAAEIKKRTRHLVKKQMTWFRNQDARIQWIEVSGKNFVSDCLNQIMCQLVSSSVVGV